MKIHHLLAMAFAIATLTACSRTAPVLNVQHPVNAKVSQDQVRTAILEAGMARKWVMTPVAPGVINGHLAQRGHSADIRIDYTATRYNINYVGSHNLMASGGMIHRNYNRWVNNLDEDIQLRLSAQALK
ncbi:MULTISPECIES: hypothetical protein [Winslowiella]|uniref:hypothetical protein n=1 Tax=Winslowiella TaxID=2997349 RepID=UPI0028BDC296|nr:hypothetical protein [Winslowiella toletana]WNN45981.1 hypothetical protein RIN69_09065 [Winslowiella toletana]